MKNGVSKDSGRNWIANFVCSQLLETFLTGLEQPDFIDI